MLLYHVLICDFDFFYLYLSRKFPEFSFPSKLIKPSKITQIITIKTAISIRSIDRYSPTPDYGGLFSASLTFSPTYCPSYHRLCRGTCRQVILENKWQNYVTGLSNFSPTRSVSRRGGIAGPLHPLLFPFRSNCERKPYSERAPIYLNSKLNIYIILYKVCVLYERLPFEIIFMPYLIFVTAASSREMLRFIIVPMWNVRVLWRFNKFMLNFFAFN